MANVSVYNIEGNQVGEIELNDAVFGVEINEHLLHMAVVNHLAAKRQGTQSAKTRSEVRGGGKKPWRQKGTGHARQGLTSKVVENKIIVLDAFNMDEIKTKKFKAVMDALKVSKALVVVDGDNTNVVLSARNIPEVKTASTNTINVYDILKYDTLVVTQDAVATIQEVYA